MLLYLLRHGDAIEQGFDDASRPLSPLGEDQALNVAQAFLSLKLPLDLILSSPLRRAQQMGEMIGKELKLKEFHTTEYLVPGSNERQLFRQLNEYRKNSVLLVGHEPHLRLVASQIISGSRLAHIEVRKASLLCLETSTAIQPESGVLKWMLTAEQMKNLKGR